MELLLLLLLVLGIAWQRKTSQRLARLEDEVTKLRADFSAAPASTSLGQHEAVQVAPPPQIEASEPQSGEAGVVQADIAAREPIESPPLAEPSAKPEGRETLESNLGARWAVWVGGVALALGGIFLIRYSIESGLIGPETRLVLAGIFGLVLIGAGEIVRRRILPQVADRYGNAMIPGALTAAGSITLIGATYAAHGYYGFIGPTLAFALLALVSLGTLALSLLHGQGLAGLGLAGSMITPALVASTAPSATVLFTFLSISWLATAAAARVRRWTIVPALANLGLAAWAIAYAFETYIFDPLPPTLALLAMVAGTGFIWPAAQLGFAPATNETWWRFLRRRPLGINLSLSLAILLPVLAFLAIGGTDSILPAFAAASLVAGLAAIGASRSYAVWPTILSAFGAVMCVGLMALILLDYVPVPAADSGTAPLVTFGREIAISLLLGAVFSVLGLIFLRRHGDNDPRLGAIWAILMSAVPVTLATISFLNFGLLGRDWTHGLYGLVLGGALLAAAQWRFRRSIAGEFDRPANLIVLGSFAGFAFSLHALTNGMTTTILLAVLGFAYVLATRLRQWPALPWAMAAALVLIFGRIGWEPTLVGPNQLGTTPFWNALLAGYGIPALLAVLAAYEMRNWRSSRIRNVLQALASLSVMMALAVLVRHAISGGVLDDRIPTLSEQSIYTLLAIGFSATLMTLDQRAPSPVFRYGSMIAGVLATINVLSLHVFALNPYFSGESTGGWPFINLLLIGYLMPALAYAGLAYFASDKRPKPYVMMLAIAGAALGFLWATLSVRRFWHGENIADWKGFLENETYTYSVVWLVIGVALLVLGSRFDARSLRIASAALVIITVLKVFLIDMSNLEGILRALSFIGLGLVLMGIGLFYQKILAKKSAAAIRVEAEPEAKA
ncbi:DUF2339 domain-containing protein [Neorhizobium sp. T786]|uniref:DUF2339 domain-containing protein n=1 Tax=Pseudorhizobium xiangyangii TaxID=2883104 RepID=UPI001CFF82CB|nr:DUF2339 domain-containing protein [Neorhizobium xiangyangii]MCB5203388.1 DUF2339 domain-containing protein [Neorhizobium xiangyangii]